MLTSAQLPTFATFDCIVLRGLPGSGKSTLAAILAAQHGYLHLEADQHFVTSGMYRFDPTHVADAHAVVVRDTLAALQAGRCVVVANTHVRLWEMAAVIGAARIARRTMCFVECRDTWPNVHGLAETLIASMRARWQPLPVEFADISFHFHAAEAL